MSLDPSDVTWDNAPQGNPVHADFYDLAAKYGARISSMDRTQAQQDALIASGATTGTNSQHVAGTAADFVVPPEQQDAFMADVAGRKQLQLIDERQSGGTGSQFHVQLRGG